MDSTAIEEMSCIEEDAKILISVNQTLEPGHVLELIKKGHAFSQDDLDNALISACQHGHKYLIQTLVNLGANVQKQDSHGNTPLLICAKNNFADISRFLIRRKADINATNSFGDTALILSIHPAGSREMVKLLLGQKGIIINHQNKDGYTALMKAVEDMDIDVIRLLLEAQKNIEKILQTKNCRNETAQEIADKLYIGDAIRFLTKHRNRVTDAILATIQAYDVDAFSILIDCQFSDVKEKKDIIQNIFKEVFLTHKKNNQTFNESEVEIVKILLQCGADMNERYYCDPLLISTEVGSYNMLQLLCKHNADRGLKSSSSRHSDLLKIAAAHGRADLIELLLTYRAEMNGHTSLNAALDCALEHKHIDCVKLLSKHGATLNLKQALRSAVRIQCPVDCKFLTENFKDEFRSFAYTADIRDLLVSAAEGGNLEIIGLILDAGANVNCTNTSGKTPLMESKNADVVNFLIKRGAVVNKWRKSQLVSSSPLTYILSTRFRYDFERMEGIVQALLEHGAHVNGKSCGGRTPLMIAASTKGCRNILRMLLERGADVNTRDGKSNTVLLVAAERNLVDNLICLLQHAKGINSIINWHNFEGSTALMVSSKNHNLPAVKELIDRGADLNITDFHGNTALLHALMQTRLLNIEHEVLTTLISAGSDINIQNNEGFTPLMLAAKNSLRDAITLLVNSGADVNAVSKHSSTGTALSVLLRNSFLEQEAQACMEYLLDQGARASYVNPDFLHKLIQLGKIQLIPKLIQSGFGPTDVKQLDMQDAFRSFRISYAVSPLCMALLTGHISLARYFLGNLFLTSSDLSSLTTNMDLRCALERNKHQECLDLLDEMSRQVMSLFKLAFVAAQAVIGTTPGREERVNMLPLPQVIKDKLLFKTEDVHLDITPVNKPSVSEFTTVVHVYSDLLHFGRRNFVYYDNYD